MPSPWAGSSQPRGALPLRDRACHETRPMPGQPLQTGSPPSDTHSAGPLATIFTNLALYSMAHRRPVPLYVAMPSSQNHTPQRIND